MNCIELFALKSKELGETMAFASLEGKSCSFLELRERIGRVQKSLLTKKFRPGDAVLIAIGPSIDLYATVIAVLGLGGSIVLVEPWMQVSRIAEVIRLVRPTIFISGPMGIFWGMRVKEIRDIPEWMRTSQLLKEKSDGPIITDVDPKTPGIITFTSGTTGAPKGVVREQGYLLDQFTVLKNSLHTDKFSGSDLCIFANWTLLNLAQGKSTVFFPAKWSAKNFSLLEEAAARYKIETLTAGPAFAAELLKMKPLPYLKDFHVGGALTSNKLFQQLFSHYPETQFVQLYGSSEVEPVCAVDARVSVEKSLQKNYFHALYLGEPIPEIDYENKADGMWVSGPHVCPFYLNNKRENELNKRKDTDGKIWHFMGDRIHIDEETKWWYQGRSQLLERDFLDEQKLYLQLGHDRAFLHREGERLFIIGESVKAKESELKAAFPYVSGIFEAQIKKDSRHRARIDRKASMKQIKLG